MLNDLTPGSGTYMNEGNPGQADWKEAFYGLNYAWLRDIQKKWDPSNIFCARTGVESDKWGYDASERSYRII